MSEQLERLSALGCWRRSMTWEGALSGNSYISTSSRRMAAPSQQKTWRPAGPPQVLGSGLALHDSWLTGREVDDECQVGPQGQA